MRIFGFLGRFNLPGRLLEGRFTFREDNRMKVTLSVGRSLMGRTFVFGKFIGGMFLEFRLLGVRVCAEVRHPAIRPF